MRIDRTGQYPIRNNAGVVVAWEVRAVIGSGATAKRDRKRFAADAPPVSMMLWRVDALDRLSRTTAARGTTGADFVEYLRVAPITPLTKRRRTQQLAFWAAQPAAYDAPVLTVDQVQTEAAAVKAGAAPVARGTLIGDTPRAQLEGRRLRQILAIAFAPSDAATDPTEFAGTSNHYRTALYHVFSILDRDDDRAINPLDKVQTRTAAPAKHAGLDMRIIRTILDHVPTKYGRDGAVSVRRIAVLAWAPFTPIQLQRLDPATDFRDIPDASRADQIAGAITVLMPHRFKGQRRRIPVREIEPLTPYGVAALRAFRDEPKAHGSFSVASLNKAFKAACLRAQTALAADGVDVDLSGLTLYQLKHAQAAAMQLASGLVDGRGRLRVDDGVRATWGHADAGTTAVYTIGAVDPLKRLASERTARYLDDLFRQPLTPGKALRRVK